MTDGTIRTQAAAHERAETLYRRGNAAGDVAAVRALAAELDGPAFEGFRDERVRVAQLFLLGRLGTLLDDRDELLELYERLMGPEFAEARRLDTAHAPACVIGHLIFLTKDPAEAAALAERLFQEVFDKLPSLQVGVLTAEALFNVGVLHEAFAPRLALAERIEHELFAGLPDASVARHAAAAYANAGVYSEDADQLELLGAHVVDRFLPSARAESDERSGAADGMASEPSTAGAEGGAPPHAPASGADSSSSPKASASGADSGSPPHAGAAGEGDELEGPGERAEKRSEAAEAIALSAALLFGQAINFAESPETRAHLFRRIESELYAEFPTAPIAERVAWADYSRAAAGDDGARGTRILRRQADLLGRHSDRQLARASAHASLEALPLTVDPDQLLELADTTRSLVLEHDDSPAVTQILAHVYLKAVPHMQAVPDLGETALSTAIELLRAACRDPEIAAYPILGGHLELERFDAGMRDELIRFLQEVLPQ